MKYNFLITLILGTLITIMSNSWINSWLGLEINLIAVIPLLIKKTNNKSMESTLIYFITQTMASVMLLFLIMINLTNYFFYLKINTMSMMLIPLMLKMSAAPLHYWLPMMMKNLSWNNSFMIITWQKIAPMILTSYLNNYWIKMMFIIMSSIIGALGSINQTSIQKILAFSSINQLSWLLITLMNNMLMWKMYFLLYSILTLTLTMVLNIFNIFMLNQFFSLNYKLNIMKFIFLTNLLSYGGLPPFLGFFPKWMIIQLLMQMKMFMVMTIMVMFNMLILFVYIQLTYSTFMLNYNQPLKMLNYKINYTMNFLNLKMNMISMWMFMLIIELMYLY